MSKKPVDQSSATDTNAAKTAQKFLATNKSVILLLAIGFLGGFLWLASMRFFLVQPEDIHYHANFAVYIDGQREEFKESTFYEEIAACTAEYDNNPKGRVHMHGNIGDVIHVHDKRVTYGSFFQNIGWTVGDDVLATLSDTYVEDNENELVFILNGKKVDRIDNRMIENTDRLLVSYGPSSSDFESQFESVASSAEEVNKYQDPSSCSGLNGTGHDSLNNRLKRATFWE